MQITIDVTQEDIDTGKKGNAFTCLVAKALSRALGVRVSCTHEQFTLSNIHFYFAKNVTNWIKTFDNHKPVKPFTFKIEIPNHYKNYA